MYVKMGETFCCIFTVLLEAPFLQKIKMGVPKSDLFVK